MTTDNNKILDSEIDQDAKKFSFKETVLSPPQKGKKIDWVLLFAVFVMGVAALSMWQNWETQETELNDVISEVKINREEVKLNRALAERNEHEYTRILQEKLTLIETMDKIKGEHVAVYEDIAETNKAIKIMAEKLMTGPRHTACDTVQILNDLRLRGIDLPPYPVENLCNDEIMSKDRSDLSPLLNKLKITEKAMAANKHHHN